MIADLSERRLQPEWMDDPSIDPVEHRRALRGLRRINWISGTSSALFKAIYRRLPSGQTPCRILDLACGGGDVTRELQKRLTRSGISTVVDGCDLSPTAVSQAQHAATRAGLPCRFFSHDACRGDLPADYDCFTSMLFLHHLDDEAIVDLLRRMQEATPLVVIDDLVRSAAGLFLAHVGARLLSRSPVVHLDGPRSVEGALTPEELQKSAERAGMVGACVTRRFPERMLLTWEKA